MIDKLFAVEVKTAGQWQATTYAPRSLESAITLRNAMKRDFAHIQYRVALIVPEDYYATYN